MSDQSKRAFILSVKRLRYFFNQLKDYELGESAAAIDQRAGVQPLAVDDLQNVTRWMEEATQAIAESRRFIELIESQDG